MENETMGTLPAGWSAVWTKDGGTRLIRPRDGQTIMAAVEPALWCIQIKDFEFAEGTQWAPDETAVLEGWKIMQVAMATAERAMGCKVNHGTTDPHWAAKQAEQTAAVVAGFPATNSDQFGSERPSAFDSPMASAEFASLTTKEPWMWLSALPDRTEISAERAAELGIPLDQLRAGVAAMLEYREGDDAGEVAAVLKAAAALAPVPLVSDGELSAVRERDEACRNEKIMRDFSEERDKLLYRVTVEGYAALEQIAARDATIADLNTRLAQFTAANVAPVDSKLEHNPFQDFSGDPRRVGR